MFAASSSLAVTRSARRVASMAIVVRHLNVHEYISMEILKRHNIPTPKGYVASTPEEAESIYLNKLNRPNEPLKDVVIKAQVLCGGRAHGSFQKTGLQGGVHIVSKPGEAAAYAEKMLGQDFFVKRMATTMANDDDNGGGIPCNKVLLMERIYMRREMYLSILMDKGSTQGPLLIVSPRGGTASIENVATTSPEFIFTEPIDIKVGLRDVQCQRMAANMGLEEGTEPYDNTITLMKNVWTMFSECDCTQIELNPLAETPEGDIVVCDASKVNFDDNAAFRQPEIFAHRDTTQEDVREVEARRYNLNYIGLEGSIGCMVNGAGLAMSTMDIIKAKGGEPANFLDVGGATDVEQVEVAFQILNSDPRCKAILVNIFGGIMRCDVIAMGIISAAQKIGIRKPIVIRLQGTNVEKARTLIEGCGFRMIMADDLEDAAEKAVGVADIVSQADKIDVGVQFEGFGV
eukprot:CAMPEP_0194042306 /NCGR_PEP_ID=MMETSP0009_2-20130614/14096_1 /TAXON_ID=210454 /ORGANISM="Grammatophora oceanica, Strain CCMP 410" /LENGTH=459 /DNA_ID=CAMNT_0038686115 /DNA_START=100 /DNA_END=1479 /DNA_ORIENTATION=-